MLERLRYKLLCRGSLLASEGGGTLLRITLLTPSFPRTPVAFLALFPGFPPQSRTWAQPRGFNSDSDCALLSRTVYRPFLNKRNPMPRSRKGGWYAPSAMLLSGNPSANSVVVPHAGSDIFAVSNPTAAPSTKKQCQLTSVLMNQATEEDPSVHLARNVEENKTVYMIGAMKKAATTERLTLPSTRS